MDYDLIADLHVSGIVHSSVDFSDADFKPYIQCNIRFLERPESVMDGDKIQIVANYDPMSTNISIPTCVLVPAEVAR